jgi:hypothetical protein
MLHVIERLGKTLLDKGLGGHDDLVALSLHFEVVARGEPQLVVELLRDCNLTAGADLDSSHVESPFGLYYNITIYYGIATRRQVETSAIVAIAFGEPEREAFVRAIQQADKAWISTVSVVEARRVVHGRRGRRALAEARG